jgi:peptidoglycan L-alanyl-D-glutamate endopeptidase CwlK
MDLGLLLLLFLGGYILHKSAGNNAVVNNTTNSNTDNSNWVDVNNNAKLNQVNTVLANKIQQLINIAKSNGYILYIDEAYRTQERQNQLYAQGRTTAGAIVTETLTSKHTQGKAVDLMPVINGTPTNSLSAFNWQLIGKWANQVGGLTWGGNWKTLKDYRHLEI